MQKAICSLRFAPKCNLLFAFCAEVQPALRSSHPGAIRSSHFALGCNLPFAFSHFDATCSPRFAPKRKFALAVPVSLPRGPPRAHPASTEAQKAHPSFDIETAQPDSRGFTQNHAEEPPRCIIRWPEGSLAISVVATGWICVKRDAKHPLQRWGWGKAPDLEDTSGEDGHPRGPPRTPAPRQSAARTYSRCWRRSAESGRGRSR